MRDSRMDSRTLGQRIGESELASIIFKCRNSSVGGYL